MSDEHQYQPGSDSLSFPDQTIVGIVDDPDGAEAAVQEFRDIGVPEDEIQVLCCDGGANRLDPEGERHGTLGRLQRLVQHFGDEDREYVRQQAQELRAGHFLIAAPAEDRERRDRLAEVLRRNGGHFIIHYASWSVTQLDA